jgi:hypothetical protein
MPNYYFLGKNFFDYVNIIEATIIPRMLIVHGKKFPLPLK